MTKALISKQQLTSLIKPAVLNPDKLLQIVDSLNQTFDTFEINTPLRICHFLAQVLHESATFKDTIEAWAPTPSQLKYDRRKDLGNNIPGDGYKYRGRGWIQLTGKTNYTIASMELNQDFVNNPQLLQQYPGAALISGWYWNKHNLNDLADKDDLMAISREMPIGMHPSTNKSIWLKKAKDIFLFSNQLSQNQIIS